MKTKRLFNLKEFKKNPNIEVENGFGKKVKIIYTELKGNYPVVGIVEDNGAERLNTYRADGTYISSLEPALSDLHFVEYTE